jgi:hypothetical protein
MVSYLSPRYSTHASVLNISGASTTQQSHLIGGAELKDTIFHRIADWLYNTGLFEQAWKAVCFGPSIGAGGGASSSVFSLLEHGQCSSQ